MARAIIPVGDDIFKQKARMAANVSEMARPATQAIQPSRSKTWPRMVLGNRCSN